MGDDRTRNAADIAVDVVCAISTLLSGLVYFHIVTKEALADAMSLARLVQHTERLISLDIDERLGRRKQAFLCTVQDCQAYEDIFKVRPCPCTCASEAGAGDTHLAGCRGVEGACAAEHVCGRAGGVRGVSSRSCDPLIPQTAIFFVFASRARGRPRRQQGVFGGSPPDS
jgi:hypothetical protein